MYSAFTELLLTDSNFFIIIIICHYDLRKYRNTRIKKKKKKHQL